MQNHQTTEASSEGPRSAQLLVHCTLHAREVLQQRGGGFFDDDGLALGVGMRLDDADHFGAGAELLQSSNGGSVGRSQSGQVIGDGWRRRSV